MDSWSIEGDLRLDGAVCGAGGVWPRRRRVLSVRFLGDDMVHA